MEQLVHFIFTTMQTTYRYPGFVVLDLLHHGFKGIRRQEKVILQHGFNELTPRMLDSVIEVCLTTATISFIPKIRDMHV
jgi:hypothetical protein